jgi:3'-phosphoadenosine 5'-phosphosulfate sulfotransferase (PAPS reductase)/FAD synthetase
VPSFRPGYWSNQHPSFEEDLHEPESVGLSLDRYQQFGREDSQAMLDYVVEQCDQVRVPRARLVVAHADLGRVEWPGTRELAEEQAVHYGLEFIAISRPQGDLIDLIIQRGKFPSPSVRFCTSDMKRGPLLTIFTRLAHLNRQQGISICRILNCLGMRAEESPARALRPPFRSQ